jgi:hypothetical protein
MQDVTKIAQRKMRQKINAMKALTMTDQSAGRVPHPQTSGHA